MDRVIKQIKEIILNTAKKYSINIDKTILFGSRVKGTYTADSDWDVLIITKEKLDKKTAEAFVLEVVRTLAKKGIDIHPIVVSKEKYEIYKNYVGTIEGTATLEGKVI